jgi:ATP-dependent Clp protease ATP-binding subunit ClpB
MNFNNYTIKASEAIQDAQNLALTNNNNQIDIAHLLLSLIQQQGGYISQIFQKA